MGHIKEKYHEKDPVTVLSVHNGIPLLGLLGFVVSGVGIFNLLSNRVELQAQQMKYMDNKIEACLSDLREIKSDVQTQGLGLKEVQTKTGTRGEVQGVSTSSGSLRRTPSPTKKP
jgi:hypothetical protein